MTKKSEHYRAAKRSEQDSFGSVELPAGALYGAQTARSLQFFDIGDELLPWGMIRALVCVKRACAEVNLQRGLLDAERAGLIQAACELLLQPDAEQHYRDQFPVRVWQTGSGTQSNMNVNEVLANLANIAAGSSAGSKQPVHPNDHVNRSQSSNDVFPTAMHVFAIELVVAKLLPAVDAMAAQLESLQQRFGKRLISGRTHMMDALPLTLGQMFGAWRNQLLEIAGALKLSCNGLLRLAIGGTAVGTGANAPKDFDRDVCLTLGALCGQDFVPHPDKFVALSGQDDLLAAAQCMARLAGALQKIANDMRLLASGPNTAFGELRLPANEPGSSIMPGKVNPTQCEAMVMVCMQVSAYVQAIETAAAAGQLQLNTCRPMMIFNFAQSVRLLSDAQRSFSANCLAGLEVNEAVLDQHLDNNLMLITFAAPELGYDKASRIARHADAEGCSIYKAAAELGLMGADDLRAVVEKRVRESL